MRFTNKYFYAILADFDFFLRDDFVRRQIFVYLLSRILTVFVVLTPLFLISPFCLIIYIMLNRIYKNALFGVFWLKYSRYFVLDILP